MHREHRITPLAAHGAHLIEQHPGPSLVRTRSGRFTLLGDVAEGFADALAWSPGTDAEEHRPDAGDADAARTDAARLRAELDARDRRDDLARWPSARRRLLLLGTGALPDALDTALRAWGVDVRRSGAPHLPDDELPDDVSLVIGYADSLAERADWERLDTLPQHGIAWLRVYREGECVFVDPLAVTADDAGSAQTTRRRIAASPVAEAFEAWRREAEPFSPLDAGTTALTLARVLHVLLAWAHDSTELAAHRLTLWKLVPSTATVTEHPVLAHPAAPRTVAG